MSKMTSLCNSGQMYTPNAECRRRKKHESVLVIFCIIITWIYNILPKILTAESMVCG